MTQQFRIFAVDDDAMMVDLLKDVLSETHLVEAFSSAESCLQRLVAAVPDLFLIDVGLPGMDGYELCRAIKANPQWAKIPVTFVSGQDNIGAKLKGYAAGGEDFIVKPIEVDELLSKVQVARRIVGDQLSLREHARYAEHTAMSAMTNMGQLGTIIEFLRKTFSCTDGPDLAQAIVTVLEQYGLSSAVQIRLGSSSHCYSRLGTDLPLEAAVLDYVRGLGRVFESKERAAFNYGGISILVNNMPRDDEESCGRIRDNLAILSEGADARRQAIDLELANRRTQEGIRKALVKLHATLDEVRAGHRGEHQRITNLMVETEEAMVKSFVQLGLTDSQEHDQIDLIKRYIDRIAETISQGYEVTDQLERLATELKQLAGQ